MANATTPALYRRRRTRLFVAYAIAAVLVGAPMLWGVVTGEQTGNWFRFVSVPAIFLVGAFHLITWRCPACNRYLQAAFFEKYCSYCGCRLTEEGME